VKVSTDELYHLVMAAHYLNVPGLLELCCEGIANLIRGKSPEHVRQCFGLVKDFEAPEVHTLLPWLGIYVLSMPIACIDAL
jgi:S-phase kinase-associated protein 1